MHASYLTASEQWRFTKPVDLAQYMCEQSSRLNRAIVGKVQGGRYCCSTQCPGKSCGYK